MRVLLVVIDAATPRVVCPAIKTGRLPVLQKLAVAGTMHESSATIFPSITPAATASIITGAYPSETGIAGAAWFDEAAQQIVYYGDDFWVIVREGFRTFLEDFLVRLNGDRLQAQTLFEMVEQAGQNAASMNYLVHKGLFDHKVHVPLLLAMLPGVPLTEIVKGPSVFCLGDLASTRSLRSKLTGAHGLLHRFGMDDATSGQLLVELIEDQAMPDLTVAYFADNDFRSHEVGPYEALTAVEGVDAALGKAFDAAGGLEKLLQDTYVIVTSDHGHCEVLGDKDRAPIHLDEVLSGFSLAHLGRPWIDKDDLMICPNMRAAQIYMQRRSSDQIGKITQQLLNEPRIEHVIWRTGHHESDERCFNMATRDGALTFWPRAGSGERATDAYGTEWSWHGDLGIVGASVAEGELEWSDYPNAFERIACLLSLRHSGPVWATAVPGCEFEVEGGTAHVGGGSHGGLHALESLSPVIVAGPTPVRLPEHMRSVDLAPLVMSLLKLPTRYAVGDPRPVL